MVRNSIEVKLNNNMEGKNMTIGILSNLSLYEILDLFDKDQRANVPEGENFPLVSSLVRNYINKGYKVVVVTLDSSIKRERVFTGDNLIVYVGKKRNSRIRAITKFNYEIRNMMKFVKKHPCDIYHAHWEYEYALASLKVDADKTVVTLHDWPYVVMQYLPGFFRYRRLQISLQVFKRGKYFTAVSPYIENLYKKFTKKNNICVIPNGSETNLDVLPQKELNAKEPYLISINNGFDNRKNVHTLLKAFGIIHRIIPNAELHLFGVGYGIDEAAQKWANEQGLLNDKLYFEGFCRHDVVCEKLREADLLIHPSREESFGLIFLEAMQNGTPCIGGLNSGAVSWVLDEGNAGVLTDIESPNDIANSVMELLKNKEKWNNLRQYGFDYVKDKFDFDYVSECYLALYNSIVDKRELEV